MRETATVKIFFIAETLIASLDAGPDPEAERAWQEEIDRRLGEIDSGTVECIPWEQVRDRLYRLSIGSKAL